MSTTATQTVSTPRQNMVALCTRIEAMIHDIEGALHMDCGYALEPEEVLVVREIVEIARKAGQVKGSRLAWYTKTNWFLFRNTPLGMSVTLEDKRPVWAVAPPKPKLIPLYVPEHLLGAMREHLGILANA